MKFEVTLKDLPAGYSLDAARSSPVHVRISEFTSTEDGDLFVSRLEGFPSQILSRLSTADRVRESMVDSLIAVIERSGKVHVYLNQPSSLKILPKRSFEAGQPVLDDDIADIETLEFDEVAFPSNCGIAVLFSKGWRKGFYYDFAPIHEPFAERRDDMARVLGGYFSYLSYQHLYKLTDADWQMLLEQRWFPFVGLKTDTVKGIINHAKSGWDIDELIDQIAAEVRKLAPRLLERWRSRPYFQEHEVLFATAVERYLAGDHVSATSIIYPRIEGLLRSIIDHTGASEGTGQSALAKAAVGGTAQPMDRFSKLLPGRFRLFMENFYFADFSPGTPADVSRHSVAHGVANSEEYNQKSSTIGLLILDQIFYFKHN